MHLPSTNPVNKILDTYYDEELEKRRAGSADGDILEEVIQGLKEYFDKCLGTILLYRFERQQYFDVKKALNGELKEPIPDEWRELKGKGVADVYGAEHLARLFGELMSLACVRTVIKPPSTPQPHFHLLPPSLSPLQFCHFLYASRSHRSLFAIEQPIQTQLTQPSSLPPRTHSPNKHGRPIRQTPQRRDPNPRRLALQALKPLLHPRLRERQPRIHGARQGVVSLFFDTRTHTQTSHSHIHTMTPTPIVLLFFASVLFLWKRWVRG